MTCIAGVEHEGKVWIGGDRAWSNGETLAVSADSKLFRLGPMLLGERGSGRLGQIAQHCLELHGPAAGHPKMHWLVRWFVPRLRRALKEHGALVVLESADTEMKSLADFPETGTEGMAGEFLIGLDGKLYAIYQDFAVFRTACGCNAVGSGAREAIAVLAATEDLPPAQRVMKALQASTKHTPHVCGPFDVECV